MTIDKLGQGEGDWLWLQSKDDPFPLLEGLRSDKPHYRRMVAQSLAN